MAVVGASAAGIFAAYLLAREGLGVEIIERSPSLDPASRTLIVTQRMLHLLGDLTGGSVVNQIRRFELFTDGRAAQFTLQDPDLIIERSKLIRTLAHRASAAGARISLGRRFHSLSPEGAALSLRLDHHPEDSSPNREEQLLAPVVIGSDGASSEVARAAGWPSQPAVPLIQAMVSLPPDMDPDTVRVWFVPQDTPYFYWLIPESPTRGALGLIGESGPTALVHLQRFLEKRRLEPIEYQAALIPAYRRWVPIERRLGRGRVFLVGDAAAHVKVTTVGGVVTGFRGAMGVAESILRGASRELRALRRELDAHLLLRRSLHHFQQADYSRLVDLMDTGTRGALGLYSRDDAVRVLWHICRRQPRLLLMGLRGILAGARRSIS